MAIEFKLAPLFGSGAVLCRRKEVRVWGTAADGQTVTGRVTTAAQDSAAAEQGRKFELIAISRPSFP